MTSTDSALAPEDSPVVQCADEASAPSPATVDLGRAFADAFGLDIGGILDQARWADQEIQAAISRHPEHAGRLERSFLLLRPNTCLERMNSKTVYQAHCREILDRVAAGEDTRLGTAAEICCAMAETSLRTPITSEAAGLYMRMWRAAGLPDVADIREAARHHEALEPSRIDDCEQEARWKLARRERC